MPPGISTGHSFLNAVPNECEGFPGGPVVKESACQCRGFRKHGSIPDWEDHLEEETVIQSSILAGEFHGQRSLKGYSPWGRKELDMTEQRAHIMNVKATDRHFLKNNATTQMFKSIRILPSYDKLVTFY